MAEPLDVALLDPEDMGADHRDRLVDLVDSLLDHGVVVRGEAWLTVAGVDLVFLGIDLVLSTPDRMNAARAGAAA